MDNLQTARVAHDIKNLIINFDSMLKLLASYITEETAEIREIKELLPVMYKQGMLLSTQLMSDSHDEREVCVMNSLLENLTGIYSFQASLKRIRISLQLPSQDVIALIPPYDMYRLLDNLLSNAVKFTPEDGHVRCSLVEVNNYAHIRIEDNGGGLPELDCVSPVPIDQLNDLKRQRGTAREVSYGVGMDVVKEMAEKHNITIYCESVNGKGTTFDVSLPLLI